MYITFPRAYWVQQGAKLDDQPFAGFGQWVHPEYSTNTNPQKWNQEAVELATLPGSSAHPTLLFYIYGAHSCSQATKLAALPSQEERDEYLINFYKPYYSLLPNYIEGSHDCTPVSTLATSWVLDDLAGNGSYSNFQIGLREADKDIEIMREGLPGRSLWFAGEHTSPFVALGTVTGAYWSGEAVGKKIAHAYGKMAPDEKVDLDVGARVHDDTREVNVHGFADNAFKE